jgi:hypothetical protein
MNRKNLLYAGVAILVLICIVLAAYFFFRPSASTPLPEKGVPAQAATTITIPELKLQFEAASQIKDLTYTIKDLGDFGIAAYFSTQTLSKAEPACSSTYNTLGALDVLTVDQWQKAEGGASAASTTNSFDPRHPNTVVRLGDMFIVFDAPNTCSSNKETLQLQQNQAEALVESLASLQKISN